MSPKNLKLKFLIKTLIALSLYAPFSGGEVYAQNTTSLPTIVSSAPPNAAALARYGEVPISYSNGLPNIGIDFGTVTAGDLTLPIGLSYHAGGVKVNDVASNVGLGWSLNAGGAIVNNGTFNSWYSSIEQVGTWNLNTGSEGIGVVQCQEYAPLDRSAAKNYIGFVEQSDAYLELDKFSYNFAGASGSMFFKKQLLAATFKGYTMPYSDWKITYSSSEITVVDDKGVIYKFDKVATSYDITTCDYGTPENGNPYGITYYLSRITSPKGNYINLEYDTETYSYDASKTQSVTVRFVAEINGTPTTNQSIANSLCSFNGLNTVKTCSIQRGVSEPRLKKITSSFGEEVNFYYSNRLDLSSTKLDRVEFGYRSPSNIYTKKREFKLSFDYFNSVASPTNETERRLKLTKVEECYGTTCAKEHSFDYNTITLPKRTSYAQDWYGYYNGQSNNYFYPGSVYLNSAPLTSSEKAGGNRNQNASYIKAGVLEKVYYPTGGRTEFEYEANPSNGIRILRIKNYGQVSGGTAVEIRRFAYNNSEYSNGSLGTFENLYEEISGQDLSLYGYQSGFQEVNCKFITVNSSPKPYSRVSGDLNTRYQYVTELIGENGENGKVEYRFSKKADLIGLTDNGTYAQITGVVPGAGISSSIVDIDYSWLDGLLLERTVYENFQSTFRHVQKTINEYKIEHLTTAAFTADSNNPKEIYARGLTIELERKGSSGENGLGDYYSFCDKYRTRYYKFISAPLKLAKVRNIQYDRGSTTTYIENISEFTYADPNFFQLSNKKEYLASSPTEYWVSEYFYPQNRTSLPGLITSETQALAAMETANMVSIQAEERTFKGTTKLGTLRNNFKLFGSAYQIESTEFAKGTNSLESRLRYHAYDSRGNPLEVSQEGGSHISYLWGYGGTLPVVQGQNITSSSLEAAVSWAVANMASPPVGVTGLEGLLEYVGDMTASGQKTAWANFLAKLYTHSNISNKAQVTTMTYKPGVGMTSQTSPNGITMYYFYDDFGRLEYVKDRDGNILKKNEYKYQVNAINTNN